MSKSGVDAGRRADLFEEADDVVLRSVDRALVHGQGRVKLHAQDTGHAVPGQRVRDIDRVHSDGAKLLLLEMKRAVGGRGHGHDE